MAGMAGKGEGGSNISGGLSNLFKGGRRLKELGSGLKKPNPNFDNQEYNQSLFGDMYS
jgi:hypothetical protein